MCSDHVSMLTFRLVYNDPLGLHYVSTAGSSDRIMWLKIPPVGADKPGDFLWGGRAFGF